MGYGMRGCKTGVGIALAVLLAGTAVRAEPVLLDGVAAHVNEHVITVGEVLQVIEPVRRQLQSRFGGEELRERLNDAYRDALKAMAERYLVLDAYRGGEARLPDWVVENRVDEFIRDNFEGDRAALFEALAQEHLTYDEWRARLEEQVVIASMRSAAIDQQVNVTPDEIRAYYDAHRDDFATPARVNLRMIVLLKEDAAGLVDLRARADAIRERLLAGEDFAVVAREVSQGTKAEAGGDWGWVEPTLLRPELAAAVQDMAPGSISRVIETDGEFYILRLEGRQSAAVKPFAEVEPDIERELWRRKSDALHDAWVGRLREDAYVEVLRDEVF